MQATRKQDFSNEAGYDADHVQRGVVIFGNLPSAKNYRSKTKPVKDAARSILNGHPNHVGLNRLLSQMAGPSREDRLAALEVIFREFCQPGSVT